MAKKATTARTRPTITGQVRDVIRSRGITPTELGRLSGVDPTVIARFMSDDPEVRRDVRGETLDKIAGALNLRVVEDAPPKPRGRRAAT
jgi:transcriptional regulator with XRE-family HTH domain